MWCNGSTTDFGSVSGGSNPPILTMAKGKKYSTPKKYWRKMGKTMKWTHCHVMSKSHKKYKWFFRKKSWFTDESLQKMSMRKPMSHEIWGWD